MVKEKRILETEYEAEYTIEKKVFSNIESNYVGSSKGLKIVYASDNNYADIMGVSLISLFENNTDACEISVFILDDNISIQNKHKLVSIFRNYERKYCFIDVSTLYVPSSLVSKRWSKSAFSRLFLSTLLPDALNKVLYLDCDVMVRQSLIELWNMDMENRSIAGINDCLSNGYKENIGMDAGSPYLNSGVLLIDLQKLKMFNYVSGIDNFIKKHARVIRYPDQDIINAIFEGEILLLQPIYNSMTIFFDFDYQNMLRYRKPKFYYSREEIQVAVDNPYIVHFTSSFLSLRPWVKGSVHPYIDEYMKYRSLSPWKDKELGEDNRAILKKTYSKLFFRLPSLLSTSFSGWLHSDVIPLIKALSFKSNSFDLFFRILTKK